MDSFSHNEFEKKFARQADAGTDIFHYYNLRIKELREEDSIKTATVYEHASDSFRRYLQPKPTKGQPTKPTKDLREDKSLKLNFRDVDQKWLRKYQKWMTDKDNSLTTVSMYLRTLRAIFNTAIKEKEISPDLYPFGEGMFTIPTGGKAKQYLEREDLRNLWEFKTDDPLIIKARDFWFFIYNASGMNVRDIIQLKDTSIIGNTIFYVRQKTKKTTKKEVIIQVPITGHMLHVIEKYGTNSKGFVFDILSDKMSEEDKIKACDAFVTFINDHMERLAKQAGVMATPTTYTARHSFSTMAIRNGAPMALIQQAFGHQSINTTQNYIGDFEDSAKRKVSNQLMDF
jgi:integrase